MSIQGSRTAVVLLSLAGLLAFGTAAPGADDAPETEAMGCYCIGTVGNVDCDYEDRVDIADLQFLVDHMFLSLVRLPNRDEANCDGVPGSGITITDLQVLLDHLFLTQADLPDCPDIFNKAPNTAIKSIIIATYINDTTAYYPVVGIPLVWEGWDLVDHPYNPPAFEFEWRLYGPYTEETCQELLDSFVVKVFITENDQVFKFGQPPATVCDTTIVGPDTSIDCRVVPTFFYVCDTSYDYGVRKIVCDTMLIDTITHSNDYGRVDTLLDIDSPAFGAPGSEFNRIAARSSDGFGPWTHDSTDVIYGVFADFPHDTTVEMNFIFWVRARDPVDPDISDLAPPFKRLSVIDPMHERDVVVISWDLPEEVNDVDLDTVRSFWAEAIPEWAASRGYDSLDFDADRDVIPIGLYTSGINQPEFLKLLLSYKAAVMFSDQIRSYLFGRDDNYLMQCTYSAVDVGVNTWVAMRIPKGNYNLFSPPSTSSTSADYRYCFGAEQVRLGGWSNYWLRDPAYRIEDFIGAISMNSSEWPDLVVDTALLHRRYDWWGPYHWNPDSLDTQGGRFAIPENVASMPLGALPDVGWCVRSADTECMYLYKSLYGAQHFLGQDFSYNGRPVMHRLDRGHFRTVHSMFTPMAFEQESAQELVNVVLDFLYNDAFEVPPELPARPDVAKVRGQ